MKTATIKVTRYDYFDEEDVLYEYEMPLDVEEFIQPDKWTPSAIRKFMHDNCVGKCSSIGDDKFIPCIKIGKLVVSCQINYYVWSLRVDRMAEQGIYDGDLYSEELRNPTTEEEFNEVLPDNDSLMDVKVTYDGIRCFLGQMTINQVASIFSDLALKLTTEFQD